MVYSISMTALSIYAGIIAIFIYLQYNYYYYYY